MLKFLTKRGEEGGKPTADKRGGRIETPLNMADIICEQSLNVKQSSLPGLCSCVAWLCPILPGTSRASGVLHRAGTD